MSVALDNLGDALAEQLASFAGQTKEQLKQDRAEKYIKWVIYPCLHNRR